MKTNPHADTLKLMLAFTEEEKPSKNTHQTDVEEPGSFTTNLSPLVNHINEKC